jgi:hypothetical protein
MADDLDDFLKQAALRRQQRQQQKRPVAKPAQPPINEPPRLRPEVPRLQPELPTAQAVDYSTPFQPTVGNLSTNLPSGNLGRGILQADERMESHVKQVFQRELSQIRTTNSVTAAGKKRDQPSNLLETPAAAAEPQPSAKVSSVSMIKQLRDPQTLRMAIIAHEIMKRPWQ